MAQFGELEPGEAFALLEDPTPVARRRVWRKVDAAQAVDDRGEVRALDGGAPVERFATPSLGQAFWVEHEGAWKLVLRWTDPADGRARWAYFGDDDAPGGRTTAPDDDRRARLLLASTLQARGNFAAAVAIYDGLIDEAGDDADAALLNNRGAARAATGDHQGAVHDYSRAIALDPTLAQAWSNRGNARTKLGQLALALADYDRAVELADDVAAIHCNRGLARKLLGQTEASVLDFDRALEIDAEFAPAYLARGSVRALTGDLDGAMADLERYLVVAPDAPQAPQVALVLARLRVEFARDGEG